jgi:N-methylhydantoinase B
MNFPILYLFRRHVKNGPGAGKFRGGAGAETAFTVHDAPEQKIKGVAYGVAGNKNSGQGIFGGYPGARSIVRLYEGTNIDQCMAENGCPDKLDDIGGKSRLLAYCEFEFKENDVLYTRQGNGGGYGDPLEREPQLVLKDFIDGLVSRPDAETVYGVVIDEKLEQVNEAATSKLRAEMKQERLRAGD